MLKDNKGFLKNRGRVEKVRMHYLVTFFTFPLVRFIHWDSEKYKIVKLYFLSHLEIVKDVICNNISTLLFNF